MRYQNKLYDVVGIGFGPSNLALCVALRENNISAKYIFLERRDEFKWHPGMLLEESTMQTPFLKDLITSINPSSRFTFLSYLREKGRLNEFINLHEFFPSRPEFNDYYAWAANFFSNNVIYNYEVESINPILDLKSHVKELNVNIRDLNTNIEKNLCAKNIVIGMGSMPFIPEKCIIDSDHVFHSENFLSRINKCYSNQNKEYSFIVVGAGQSSAEISFYLLDNYPNSNVSIISSGFVFKSIDDNPFVNAYYSGDKITTIYDLNQSAKELLFKNFSNSNYSVVDKETIHKLAKKIYDEKTINKLRFKIFSFSRVIKLIKTESAVEILAENLLTNDKFLIRADGVCFATGYTNNHLFGLLKNIDSYMVHDSSNNYLIGSDYKIKTIQGFQPKIYVQGYAEKTHGFTEGTVAGLADRAQTILTSLNT